MNRTFCVLATIAAMGLGTASAAAATSSKPTKHAVQKKSHVAAHHGKSAAEGMHTSKPAASHQAVKSSSKSHKPTAHEAAPKSHAKPLSRLEKRRA